MNSTLLHNNYPGSYPLTSDFKYQSSDRHYSNSQLPSNDFIDAKNGLVRSSLGQSMQFGNAPTGLDYSSNHLQHDQPCNTTNSHLILTPPQSGDESSSTVTNPSSSSYSYASLPKVSVSNASGSEYYSSGASNFLRPTFNGTSMTQIDGRGAPMQIPAPLSPPYSYGPMNSSFPPQYQMGRPLDYNNYNRHVPFDIFNRPRPSLPHSFPPPTSIFPPPSMPNPNRPEGPPFEDTQKLHNIVNSRGQSLTVDVVASIPKGFFRVDDKWTCYRRNYFSVSCGFTYKTPNLDGQVYLQRSSHHESITGYAVSITAKTAAANNTDSETRGLVQHTPKRDKATESIPTRHSVVPTPPQALTNGHVMSHSALYPTSHHLSACLPSGLDAFGHTATQSPQTNYTFERIQFQKATANNGKRRAQQQYFHVVVKLEVNIGRPGGPDDWVIAATRQSHPMVVRGRSPGHYKDSRRDSQTSMDPDGGSGHCGDSHGGFLSHQMGNTHASNSNNAHALYRQSHHFGTSFSHRAHAVDESESSTASPGSCSAVGSSPNKRETCPTSCAMTRTLHTDSGFDRVTLSPILSKTTTDIMSYPQAKKRPFEDDMSDCASSFYPSAMDTSYHNPSFDFSATSASQALCA